MTSLERLAQYGLRESMDHDVGVVGAGRSGDLFSACPEAFGKSWLHAELQQARSLKQWFKKGRTT